MATTIVRSQWTGTRGVLDAGLPDDWNEALTELKEKSLDFEVGYSPQFVATIWEFGRVNFGRDAKNMTVVELAEYWYEFG